MNPLPRRVFVKGGALAIASVGLPVPLPSFLQRSVFAAQASGRRKTLVCVFLRGAADGLSMVVPHADPDLYRLRSTVAIPRPGRDKSQSTLDLDGFFGLHPAMEGLLPLWKDRKLAIVHACGSPHPTRSHFDAMDFMESGAPGNKAVRDGWLARAVKLCPEDRARRESVFRAVSLGGGLPRSLQGDAGALAIPDLRTFGIRDDIVSSAAPIARRPNRDRSIAKGAQSAPADLKSASGFEAMYEKAVGDVLHGTGKESFAALQVLRRIDPNGYVPADGAVYPGGKFGDSLRQLAQLIKADVGLEVGFAEIGGWDTHANQATPNNPAQGNLANNLRTLANGLAAFARDLGSRMDDVVVLTMSEFGRTARQNGTGGTDHGHATAFLSFGGAVEGGKVYGEWPGLSAEKLHDGRDLALTTDFRLVFAEAAVRHLGVQRPDQLFPGFALDVNQFRGLYRRT